MTDKKLMNMARAIVELLIDDSINRLNLKCDADDRKNLMGHRVREKIRLADVLMAMQKKGGGLWAIDMRGQWMMVEQGKPYIPETDDDTFSHNEKNVNQWKHLPYRWSRTCDSLRMQSEKTLDWLYSIFCK